jgi:hypothetical protein
MDAPATLTSNPLSAAARFALIVDGLRAAVAARIADDPITGPMIVYIWTRLGRINQRFQALAALIFSGEVPPQRVYRGRAARETAPPPPCTSNLDAAWRLLTMRRFAWLCMVAHNRAGPANAAIYGEALRRLLGDPEMAALLAATPRVGKLLRPLCWGLGIEASLLRSRPAPAPPVAAIAEATIADAGTGHDGLCSDGCDAAAPMAARGGLPEATRADGAGVAKNFAAG